MYFCKHLFEFFEAFERFLLFCLLCSHELDWSIFDEALIEKFGIDTTDIVFFVIDLESESSYLPCSIIVSRYIDKDIDLLDDTTDPLWIVTVLTGIGDTLGF